MCDLSTSYINVTLLEHQMSLQAKNVVILESLKKVKKNLENMFSQEFGVNSNFVCVVGFQIWPMVYNLLRTTGRQL